MGRPGQDASCARGGGFPRVTSGQMVRATALGRPWTKTYERSWENSWFSLPHGAQTCQERARRLLTPEVSEL